MLTWRNATSTDVNDYLDPYKFINDAKQKLQFMDLTKSSGVSVVDFKSILKGKGILEGYGQAFIDGGE